MVAERFEEYRTAEGDMVDLIAFNRFGTSAGMTERILDANPGLALDQVLEAGRVILIPVPEVKERKTARRLWD